MDQLKWYEMYQNSSGGNILIDDDVTPVIFIQAESAEHVNDMVAAGKFKNVYFGFDSGNFDCGCCGTRWTPVDDDKHHIHIDGEVTDQRLHSDKELKYLTDLLERHPEYHDVEITHIGSGRFSITTGDIKLIAAIRSTYVAGGIFSDYPAGAVLYYLDGTKAVIR